MHEDTKEQSDRYGSCLFWHRWIDHAKRNAKKELWADAAEAWSEYELGAYNKTTIEGTGEQPRFNVYPLWWSSIKTLQPAYYSRTPVPVGHVRFNLNDPVARTGAQIAERLAAYGLETSPFDVVMQDVVMDFLVSDWGITRVHLEGEEKERERRIALQQSGEDEYREEGASEAYLGEVMRDAEGFFYNTMEKYTENNRCYPVHVPYDEVLMTPAAKCWEEVDEIAYRFCYSKAEAMAMFPDIPEEELPLRTRGQKKDPYEYEEEDEDKQLKEEFVEGWEIWHKPTKRVRWVSMDYHKGLLKEVDDPYKLKGFFPSPPPLIGTKRRKKMYGRPAFQYLKPLLAETHECMERVFKLFKAVRRRAIVDASLREDFEPLIAELDESEYLFVQGMQGIIERGGLANLIQQLPVGELSGALAELANLLAMFENKFNELFGLPDIMRGVSDPLETAKAQEIKSFSASNRFRFQMNQVAEHARCVLELLVDLKLNAYPTEHLARICGYQFLDQEDQIRFLPALQMIRDDMERCIRVDIETDSTSYINEAMDQANRNAVIQTVNGGLEAVSQMPPPLMALGLKTVLYALSGMRKGKDLHDEVQDDMAKLIQQALQPPEGPPPPDYDAMKLQLEQAKLEQKNSELQFKAMMQQSELQLRAQKQQADAQLAQLKLQLESQAQGFYEWTEQLRLNLEQQGMNIQEYKARIQGTESMLEEKRLADEVQVNAIAALRPEPVQEQQPPAPGATVIINNQATPEPSAVDPLLDLIL